MKNSKLLTLFSMLVLSLLFMAACGNDEVKPANTESSQTADVAEIKTMTGEDLVKQNSAKEKDNILLIDVRSEEEYGAGHIQHAINISLDEIEGRLAEIEDHKNKAVILYCNTGNRSGQAAEILVNNGFTNVTNAAGVKEFDYDLVQYTDIRGAAFETLIASNEDIVLVDVRPEKQAAEEGMIAGAINIPFDAVEANLDKLPEDKMIALYCNTGTKSAEVAVQLEGLGYKNVVNSIEGVKEHSFEVVN